MEIFHPYATTQIKRVAALNCRFAHYTNAEAAIKILQSREVWMRSSSCMVDFREIEYGLECLSEAYEGTEGSKLKKLLDEVASGFVDAFQGLFNAWIPHFRDQTYLTCFSEHDPEEDQFGRLSMWRAFGTAIRVALVFNNKPFLSSSNALSVYSSPVGYFSRSQFQAEFARVVAGVESEQGFLRERGKEDVMAYLFQAFKMSALCTKHPGFHEEKEWRVIHSPTQEPSERVLCHTEVIGGVPQPVYKIPLRNFPDEGLEGVEVPELLDRIIIGPTEYPWAVYQAFKQVLTAAGVPDAGKKIIVSDIPLRHL